MNDIFIELFMSCQTNLLIGFLLYYKFTFRSSQITWFKATGID